MKLGKGKAKVTGDSVKAGKGAKGKAGGVSKASRAIGKTMSSAPDGGKPDGNPTADVKKGSPSKRK